MKKKKLAFVTQPEYFRFIYENDLDDIYEVKEFSFKFDMPIENFSELIDFNADYNIFFRAEFAPVELFNKLKGKKIALSSEPFPRKIHGKWEYTKDSINRYFTFRHRIRNRKLDYVFHYDASSLPLFKADGLKVSGEFAFPVATGLIKKRNIKKEYDLFFLGRSTDHREKYFGSLKHYYRFLHIAHGIYGNDEFCEYVNKAKINLNVHAENEVSWEPRLQILLASGGFVISEKITPNKYLIPGEDYVEVNSPQEMFEKVKYYLDNPKKMEKIVNNAQKKIEKYFEAKTKIPKLIEDIEKGNYQRFAVTKSGSVPFVVLEGVHKAKKWIKK